MTEDPYAQPSLYDLEYSDHVEDLAFYVELSRRFRHVLELGCGTGRLTLPMARAGARVDGVDRAQAMLDALATKVRAEPLDVRLRVRWLLGDFRTLDPPGRYPLVLLPFNALHHCHAPAEVAALLHTVRCALASGGCFALDAYLPDPELYERDPTKRYEEQDLQDPRTGEQVHSWEQGWWDPERRIHHVVYTYVRPDGRHERSHLALRMYDLHELRSMMVEGGLELVHEARDFRGTPLGYRPLKWVAALRPAR